MSLSAETYATFAPLQKRVRRVLSLAQIFSGIGSGAVVSVGALLAVELSGSTSWGGSMTTAMTLGAALAAMPLARYAARYGRRLALVSGIAIAWLGVMSAIAASIMGAFPLLLTAGTLIGVGTAVNLQARFAATDLAAPEHRARDLSLVVWTTTIGSVAGPNLLGVGESIGATLGLPPYTGIFVISGTGMLAAALILFFGLRPDPSLVLAQATQSASSAPTIARTSLKDSLHVFRGNHQALSGLIAIVAGHAVMVAIMSVTSVHMNTHGTSLTIIGFTISLHILGMYAFSPLVGLMSDKVGALPTIYAGGAVLIVSVLFAGLGAHNNTLVTVGLFLLGLGWSIVTVAGAGHITAHVSSNERLAVQGASDMFMSLAGGLGGIFAGLTLASIGYMGLNLAAGLLTAGMIVFIVALNNVSRQPKP
ncbi:MFS transporter [Timonella sp. A28]|uniref:MFS transporter n=1 Tax=Timonella sp. A28 TaxID=3442640 RepID=UPI003EC08D4A